MSRPDSQPERVLVAMWPDWPVVAAGYPADVAAVVVAANRVQAATPAARAEGVRVGLRRREAQGRCPGLVVSAADPGRDARAWEPVVAAVEKLTPAVEVLGPGRLSMATRGPSRYFGGDSSLARLVLETVERVAARRGCQIGVADGLFTATLAASAASSTPGEPVVVSPGASRKWLAPQPIHALGPGYEDLSDLLARLGIRTLGGLASLPGPAVLGRFGLEGQTARRLALGQDEQGVQARTPPPDLACFAELDPPEQRVEAAAFVAKMLADELNARLSAAGLAVTKVAIEVETEHGEKLVRHWRHEGALSATALAERTRWQLEGWVGAGARGEEGGGPSGGLTSLRLTPEEVRPDRGRQLDFWGGVADADARASRAMARVQGLLGPDGVCTAVLEGGRGFADQVRLVPWGDALTAAEPAACLNAEPAACLNAEIAAPWPGRLGAPAPALVHQPPRPAELLDASGAPVRVSGRGAISAAPAALRIDGHPPAACPNVVGWAGPWPLEERWWEHGGRRRARVQVLLEGGEAHLLFRESGRWWVEASYA